MCTVSYIPTRNGFILTSNRDENPYRMTTLPKKVILKNNTTITCPRDYFKGGTWIAMDDHGRAACLLNGAFLRHIKRSSYRESRGVLVINAFEAENFGEFVNDLNFEGFEPFTLLLIEPNNLLKIIWDGHDEYIWNLSTKTPHLWSSATLYSSTEHAKKERYFIEALRKNIINENQILQIHGKDADTPFIINHQNIKTVSITQLYFNGKKTKLTYILKKQHHEKLVPSTFNLN